MNILMMSNTYTPIVGGLERSVRAFTEEYRRLGHRVVIVAPSFKGIPRGEKGVVRVPSLKRVKGTDFSLQIPIPGFMERALKNFTPDIVHVHHPFFIGDTALRVAYRYRVPVIFTHHTLFEHNTHYVAGDSEWFKRFIVRLTTGYANLADRVLAPSPSVKKLLRQRGVRKPIDVVPSGIDLGLFRGAQRGGSRKSLGFSGHSFVIGYAGRLALEKNLDFLTRAVANVLRRHKNACFLVVGDGPFRSRMREALHAEKLDSRAVFTGILNGKKLAAAYSAMDVFAFSSKSETQGLAALEAMASGVPVVALDACGLRDVVRDKVNGRLCRTERAEDFSASLEMFMDPLVRERASLAAQSTAFGYSVERCAKLALISYRAAISENRTKKARPSGAMNFWQKKWVGLKADLKADWVLAANMTKATQETVRGA